MKTMIQILSIFILFSSFSIGQRGDGPMGMGPGGKGKGPGMKKIQELERIKLIEALNMNEETTLKFFARHTQHQKEMKEIEDRLESVLDEMDNELNKEKDVNQQKIKKLLDDFYTATNDINKGKNDFLTSLKDILSVEQTAKLIVFERNFREEMRQILMKQRMNRMKKMDQ